MNDLGYWRNGAIAALFGVLATACGGPSADEHLANAEMHMKESRPAEALIEYRLALDADPQRGDIRLKLADAHFMGREFKSALDEYSRAADLMPTSLDAQLKAAQVLLLAGRFEDAKTRAEKAFGIDPKSAEAQILIGNALAGLKDLDGAIEEYQQAIALNPSADVSYQNMGLIQLARGKTEEAEAMFRKAVETSPKSIQAHMALANFLWATRRPDETEAELKNALAIEPQNLQTNRALGVFYISTKRINEAEPYFQIIAKTAKTTQASLGLADFYSQAKRYDEAKKVLREVADTKDGYAPATLRLASFDVMENQRAQAMTRTREVLGKNPNDLPARLFMTRLLILDSKRDEAIREATAIASQDGNGTFAAEAHFLLAQVYTDVGRSADAIKSLEQVLRLHPRPFAATIALGMLHLQTGDLSKATTYADQVLGTLPNNPDARALKARVLMVRGERDNAAEMIAGLKKQYPQSAAVLNLVAIQHFTRNELKAAREAYAQAAKLSPNNSEALMGIIRTDVASGESALAVRRIEEALKVATPTPAFLTLAGSAYAAAGNVKKAEELWQRAVDADPSRLQAYGLLAQLYVQNNRLGDAVDSFKEILKRDDKSIAANTMLGMLFDMQKRTADAEQQYKKTLSIDSRAAVAANNLAWIYASRPNQLDEALELAQVAVQQMPDEPNVNDTIGWIYYKKNLPSQAIRHLEVSVEKGPQLTDSQFHLGMAYAMAGEVEKAKTTLERALKIDPKSTNAEDARATLASLKF